MFYFAVGAFAKDMTIGYNLVSKFFPPIIIIHTLLVPLFLLIDIYQLIKGYQHNFNSSVYFLFLL